MNFWSSYFEEVRRDLIFRQPFFNDPRRDLRPRGKAQIPEDIAHMPLGGSFAKHQQIGNLPARFALRNECRYLAFTCR